MPAKIFTNGINSKPLYKKFVTKITIFKSIDDTGSMDILDLNDCGPKNIRGYRVILVVIENFSKFGWPISLKKTQSVTNSFGNILKSSYRKPNLTETDDGSVLGNKMFTNLLIFNTNIRFHKNTSRGAVFAERFKNLTELLETFLNRLFFKEMMLIGLIYYPPVTIRYNKRKQSSTNITPIRAFFKKNEKVAK